jgi:hypothetical protein
MVTQEPPRSLHNEFMTLEHLQPGSWGGATADSDPERHFVQTIRYCVAERIRIQVLNDHDAACGQEV